MLNIKNLNIKVSDHLVINEFDLQIKLGSCVVLMGPNGSGKSSLAKTLMGHPDYRVISGEIYFKDQNITTLLPHERAKLGIFLAFQQPSAIAGLQVFNFTKNIYEACTGKAISVPEFEILLLEKLNLVGLDRSFIYRDVNTGFSGGEKKRFEMLQCLLLQPKLAILDEIDSGLDIDALKLFSQIINLLRKKDPDFTILLITHYNRVLDFLQPDSVHIMQDGKLIRSGDFNLAKQIELNGYENLI